jgi:hypothetical protein
LAILARSSNHFARPSENGPWPVHARAFQGTRPSYPRPSRARQLSRPAACGPAARSSAPPRPGRNLGLGREFGLAPFPAWAAALAQLISAARGDRTVGLQCRWIKTSERRRSLNPSPFLCLLSHLLSHGDASEDEGSARPPRHRRRREDDNGAKPLAGARARPWQSGPPSSGFGPLPLATAKPGLCPRANHGGGEHRPHGGSFSHDGGVGRTG